jgi:DNA-binding response OmpR family regulator/DNA-binding CsgD family transcriptional regulator
MMPLTDASARDGATRSTILVVDDTPDTLAMLTDALERGGYTVLVATAGQTALGICETVTPDLVLLDAIMPGLDGFETCRRLKAAAPVAHVPVIFMTALSETEHVVQGLAAGGVDYVTKPIVLDELFARIRVHLGNARATQSARLALDAAAGFLLAFDRAGALLWTTPQAGRLLDVEAASAFTPATADRIARRIAGEVGDHAIELDARENAPLLSLAYIGPAGPGEFLFRLSRRERDEDVLSRRFALTMREAEVLVWIARGKPNRDIGEILAVSPRTVNKHLEVIYRKLGVENRASAAVLASRVLAER